MMRSIGAEFHDHRDRRPAASGKGPLGKRLAARYRLRHLTPDCLSRGGEGVA